MSASRLFLSGQDLERLVKSGNADDRAVAAHKVCRLMERHATSPADRAAAQEIIRIVSTDAAELVRRALAVTLRTSVLVPQDVARRLAHDADAVAEPLLIHSPVFGDDDLADIVRTGGPVRQIAIARRTTLSEPVTDALSAHGVEEAVVIACANDNARFNEAGLSRVLDRFGASEMIHNALVHRQALPLPLTQRLMRMVGDTLKPRLLAHHTPEKLIRHDPAAERLTPSLMLRALGRGDLRFFEHALSTLSGIAHERTWLMVHDAGPLGFRAIYDRAGLPARLFNTFRMAVETCKLLKAEQDHLDPLAFQERLIERFLTQAPYAPQEDLIWLYKCLTRPEEAEAPPAAKAA